MNQSELVAIDLFSLYILKTFFQISSYAREYVRTTYIWKKQNENSLESITWSEMGKQNVQAKEVYSM